MKKMLCLTVIIPLFVVSVFAADFIQGDINEDGVVNGTDLTYLTTFLDLGFSPYPVFNMEAADVNFDGLINRDDYTVLRSFLIEGVPMPSPPEPEPEPSLFDTLSLAVNAVVSNVVSMVTVVFSNPILSLCIAIFLIGGAIGLFSRLV